MHDQEEGRHAEERDWRDVARRIERHRRHQLGVDAERAGRRDKKLVAVGRRLEHEIDADVAVGAGPVLDDERLAMLAGQLFGGEAREQIDRAARRAGCDDAHRPVGPPLRARHRKDEQRESERDACRDVHRPLLFRQSILAPTALTISP